MVGAALKDCKLVHGLLCSQATASGAQVWIGCLLHQLAGNCALISSQSHVAVLLVSLLMVPDTSLSGRSCIACI